MYVVWKSRQVFINWRNYMFYTQNDPDIYYLWRNWLQIEQNLRNPERPQGHRAKELRKKYDETHRQNGKLFLEFFCWMNLFLLKFCWLQFTLKDFLFEVRDSTTEYIVGRFLNSNLKSNNQFLNLKIRAVSLVRPDGVSHSQ